MAKPYARQRPVSPQLQFPWSEPPSLPRVPLPDAPHVLPTHLWTSLLPDDAAATCATSSAGSSRRCSMSGRVHEKITPHHHELAAYVYVRQSTC